MMTVSSWRNYFINPLANFEMQSGMASRNQALILFVTSTFSLIMASRIRSYIAAQANSVSERYRSSISRLFKVVSKGTRTVDGMVTTQRFQHFQQLFSRQFPDNSVKIVHVAGTKGKGSTVEYIASGIEAAGHRVGVFTSPHLHTARERIKIGKSLITMDSFSLLAQDAMTSMQNLTWAVFFDLLLHMGIRYFGDQHVNYIVLEAGIGGRYDSTNFVRCPDAAVITSISLDHQAMLGNTVEDIAWQKAGIIKTGGHVFTTTNQPTGVLEVFRKQCREVGATLHEVAVSREEALAVRIQASFETEIENVCLSAAVLRHLGVPTSGMSQFYWPCRGERFTCPDGIKLVIDGCHNGDSVKQFLSGMRSNYPSSPLMVIFGAGQDKSVDDMLQSLGAFSDSIIFVQSSHFRSLTETDICNRYLAICQPSISRRTPSVLQLPPCPMQQASVPARLRDALQWAREQEGERPVIAVCGSLFVATDAREEMFRLYPELFSASDWVRMSDPKLETK